MSDITAGIQEIDPDTMKTFAGAGTAPYDPVWVDHRDLLMHGEQFINARGRFAPPLSTGRNFRHLPRVKICAGSMLSCLLTRFLCFKVRSRIST